MTIFVIGYMASGKTTFGRALARRMGCDFYDLDFYIEQRFRRPISRIFAEEGEERFRQIEANMLRELGDFEDIVVACGGGTPCFHENMDYMQERGLTVWLDSTPDCITRRLIINNSRRPLMAGKSEEEIASAVTEGLRSRHPFYSQAKIRICGDRLESKAQISDTIDNFYLQLRPFCANFVNQTPLSNNSNPTISTQL